MLDSMARTLVWLGVGEGLSRLSVLPVSAPVLGLVLLYADLTCRGGLPEDLRILADRALGLLGLLFVPAGVGIVAHTDLLARESVPVIAAIVGGTLITLVMTAVVARASLARRPGNTPAGEIASDVPA